jgi:hypothetical protein
VKMQEIPMPYVKANQLGVVLFILLAFITKQPLILALLWFIQIIGLLFGTRASLFIWMSKPFLNLTNCEMQAQELQRFNNTLGMVFLTLSLFSFALGSSLFGYIFSGFFALAALLSIMGFCIGCMVYFQFKQLKYKIKKKN